MHSYQTLFGSTIAQDAISIYKTLFKILVQKLYIRPYSNPEVTQAKEQCKVIRS